MLADDDETDDRVESHRRQQKVVVDDILSPVSPCSTVVSRRVAKSEWGGVCGGHLIGMWPAERPSNVTIATSRDSVPWQAGDVGLSLATIFASSSCCRLSMTLISKRKFALMHEKLLRGGGMRMGFEPIGHYHHTSYHGRGRLGGSLSFRFGFAPG